MSRLAKAWARTKRYFTYDLKEIIAPSPLPDPPGVVPEPRRPLGHWLQAIKKGSRAYVASWRDPVKLQELKREYRGEPPADEAAARAEQAAAHAELNSLWEEFGDAARGGSQTLRPFLINVYQTRAAAYRGALKEFVVGYKEGFREAFKPGVPGEAPPAGEAPPHAEATPQGEELPPGGGQHGPEAAGSHQTARASEGPAGRAAEDGRPP